MTDQVGIIGLGKHPFGRHDASGVEQGAYALQQALHDAGVAWKDVQVAFGGSQDAGNADALVNHLGLTGLPFINVSNGCATGGSSLICAINAIRAGEADIAVAVGFDKHARGAFNAKPEAWGLPAWYGQNGLMLTTQFFAMKTQRYLHDHGIDVTDLSRIAERAFRNGARNPEAWRQQALSAQDIAEAPPVNPPLTKYMFCSPAEGAAAVVLASERAARRLSAKPVWLKAVAVRTRYHGSFEVFAPALAPERAPAPTVIASEAAYQEAGVGPSDIQVAQVQDTDAGSEIMHLAENGFCAHGEQGALLASGATEIDGRLPINTDGGCMANGEPIGASGLRQVHEICLQLRGDAGERQVPNHPKLGYTHVYGAPGISAVTILQR